MWARWLSVITRPSCWIQKIKAQSDLIAALIAKVFERALSQYIEKLFDGYANKFNTHLVQGPEYEMPPKLIDIIKQPIEFHGRRWNMLDFGCGTGMASLEILPHVRQLVGIDPSNKMLARAHA